jgi:hypothetical protein
MSDSKMGLGFFKIELLFFRARIFNLATAFLK